MRLSRSLAFSLVVLVTLVYAVLFRFHSSSDTSSSSGRRGAAARIRREIMPRAHKGTRFFERERITLGSLESAHTTVVAAYFDLSGNGPLGHPNSVWLTYVSHLLRSCEAPLVMFTDKSSLPHLQAIRGELGDAYRTTFLVYEEIMWLLKELEKEHKQTYRHFYLPDAGVESASARVPGFQAMLALRAHMTSRVAALNPYESRFFIYNEASSWRSYATMHWPDAAFVAKLHTERLGDDRLLFVEFSESMDGVADCSVNRVEPGFFAGSANAVKRFAAAYYELHAKLMEKTVDKSDVPLIGELIQTRSYLSRNKRFGRVQK